MAVLTYLPGEVIDTILDYVISSLPAVDPTTSSTTSFLENTENGQCYSHDIRISNLPDLESEEWGEPIQLLSHLESFLNSSALDSSLWNSQGYFPWTCYWYTVILNFLPQNDNSGEH
jgi:hypothetical protein